jgi:hypothetical protein
MWPASDHRTRATAGDKDKEVRKDREVASKRVFALLDDLHNPRGVRHALYLLCELDVLAPGALRALPHIEGHGLTLAEVVERGLRASRLMEEILSPVARGDEPETLVAYEPFDRATH